LRGESIAGDADERIGRHVVPLAGEAERGPERDEDAVRRPLRERGLVAAVDDRQDVPFAELRELAAPYCRRHVVA
jgi:hypothetical protein